MPESGLPKICLSIKAKKNLAKIVKINFFKTLQLTNSLQQSSEHSLKKTVKSQENSELCDISTYLLPSIPCCPAPCQPNLPVPEGEEQDRKSSI